MTPLKTPVLRNVLVAMCFSISNQRTVQMPKTTKPPKEPKPITAPKIKTLASKALKAPSTLTTKETQELGASVMRHIEKRGGKIT